MMNYKWKKNANNKKWKIGVKIVFIQTIVFFFKSNQEKEHDF